MLSGNGRHRRPRQAPALLVAAGVTGSAIAIPLMGAAGAHAADGTTWDRVADCETRGAWSQNTGNGYYGGLQLTQDDWEAYGGLEFAAGADQASRSQQIAVGERILAARGADAWPACGLLAGLGDDKGDAHVDTGVSESPDTSVLPGTSDSPKTPERPDSPDSPDPAGVTSPEPAETPEVTPTTPETPKASKTTEAPEAPKSPEASAPSTRTTATSPTSPHPDNPDNSAQKDTPSPAPVPGEAGTGRHRGPSADEAAGGTAADGVYTVRAGDNLSSIADSLDLQGGWPELYAGNEAAIGADPDLILPGQKLAVGGESGEK